MELEEFDNYLHTENPDERSYNVLPRLFYCQYAVTFRSKLSFRKNFLGYQLSLMSLDYSQYAEGEGQSSNSQVQIDIKMFINYVLANIWLLHPLSKLRNLIEFNLIIHTYGNTTNYFYGGQSLKFCYCS